MTRVVRTPRLGSHPLPNGNRQRYYFTQARGGMPGRMAFSRSARWGHRHACRPLPLRGRCRSGRVVRCAGIRGEPVAVLHSPPTRTRLNGGQGFTDNAKSGGKGNSLIDRVKKTTTNTPGGGSGGVDRAKGGTSKLVAPGL